MVKKFFLENRNFAVILIIALLLMIVSVSGCIRAETQCAVVISKSDGLDVLSFEPSYYKVPVGNEIELQMEMQNKGNSEASNIKANLWSHPGFKVLDGEVKDDLDDMAPPNMEVCSAGDAQIITWKLKALCDPMESTLAASLEYDYADNGWATIFLVSHEEAQRTAGKFKETGENYPSYGPIQVEIEPLQTEPVILRGEGDTFDVRVEIKNIGIGVAGEGGTGAVKNVKVTVSGPCKIMDGTNEVDEIDIDDVVLSMGMQEAIETVKLKYTGLTLIKDFCKVNAEVDYHYRIVKNTKSGLGVYGSRSEVEECRSASP